MLVSKKFNLLKATTFGGGSLLSLNTFDSIEKK